MNQKDFEEQFRHDGYVIVPNILDLQFIQRCRKELSLAIEEERARYGEAAKKDYGMVMLCSLYGGAFNEVFDVTNLMEPFNTILGAQSIVYAYTSSSMPPNGANFSNRVHVDCPRFIPGYVSNMGATIALDDFELDNGATYFLPGSHLDEVAPDEKYFFNNAKRFVAPAGSVLFFNARLWHMGGQNKTSHWRHAITLNMCRSFMKQRIDIPRAMISFDTEALTLNCKQKLGFFSQPPTSMEEYYLPIERRNYRQAAE